MIAALPEGGARLNRGDMQAGRVRGSHSVGRCGISGRSRDVAEVAAPGVRAAKSFESRKRDK